MKGGELVVFNVLSSGQLYHDLPNFARSTKFKWAQQNVAFSFLLIRWILGGQSFVFFDDWDLTCWISVVSCLLTYSRRSSAIFPRRSVSVFLWCYHWINRSLNNLILNNILTKCYVTILFRNNERCTVMLEEYINLSSMSGLINLSYRILFDFPSVYVHIYKSLYLDCERFLICWSNYGFVWPAIFIMRLFLGMVIFYLFISVSPQYRILKWLVLLSTHPCLYMHRVLFGVILARNSHFSLDSSISNSVSLSIALYTHLNLQHLQAIIYLGTDQDRCCLKSVIVRESAYHMTVSQSS